MQRTMRFIPRVSASAEQPPRRVRRQSFCCANRYLDCAYRDRKADGGRKMLWTIFVILLVLWLLGLVSSYTLGGFIHVLLVLAIVIVLIRIIQGRRPV